MTKAEFIAKYGLEKYLEFNEKKKANYRYHHPKKEKKVKPIRKKKVPPPPPTEDMVIVKVCFPLPQDLSLMQRKLRAGWSKKTDKPYILLTNAGKVKKGKYPVIVELHQLGMDKREQEMFKDFVMNNN